ncbi:MAG: hypothetical protein HY236_12310 [Acidobacteria bacterium]|nr:hypothetical protein [Acidobacteriota bacterium]
MFIYADFDANFNYFERAIAFNQDGSKNGPASPAARGSVIVVYLTGQGPLSSPVPTGQAATSANKAALAYSAIIGPALASVEYLGATPGFVGLSQANIRVPNGAPVGDQTLALNVGGHDSNRPLITIK